MALTFDGPARRIILDRATISAAEIWTAWVEWQSTHQNWDMAMRQEGGSYLGDGKYTAIYFFLMNGWRVRPMEMNHVLVISGNLGVDGGGNPVVQTLGSYNVSTQYSMPLQAQAISIAGGGGGGGTYTGPTAAEIAQAVWSYQP